MILKNGAVFFDGSFLIADLRLENGRIAEIGDGGSLAYQGEESIDCSGNYVIPGLVDLHIHACAGCDFCDATEQSLSGMARYLGANGITSFVAASMALDIPRLERIFRFAGGMMGKDMGGGAVLRGINMEGPFFSKAKKGAQDEKNLTLPDIAVFERLMKASNGSIKLLDLAPELEGAAELIEYAKGQCTVSLAHTTADYDTAANAFRRGASHVTHLFNAMPPFAHREPGVIGAASDFGATVELICDGIHLHPSVVRSAFKWFGDDKAVLISDAMAACGMPNGEYELGGQRVFMRDHKATLADGTIAGSATNLFSCFKNVVAFGVALESAVKAATINPARAARIDDEVGSISVGKRADLLLLNGQLDLAAVFIGGRRNSH